MSFLLSLAILIYAIGIFILMWFWAKKGQAHYPTLIISVPNEMENSAEFQDWAAKNGYHALAQGSYKKGKGLFTSATLIEFLPSVPSLQPQLSQSQPVLTPMQITEEVNFLFAKKRFAINAPIFLGKPLRKRKIKKINELLSVWQLPPISF